MELLKQEIDLKAWKRGEHFAFFHDFYEPYYGICSRIDCTDAYRYCKEHGYSFFLSCLYWTLKAAQEVEAFKLRIDDKRVFRYERIDGGSAVDRPDGTFGFGAFPYQTDMKLFLQKAAAEVSRVRASTGLCRTEAPNVIRYSSLPWIDFTSITHAQKSVVGDSCPRITFGKMSKTEGHRSMPIAVHVNHALVDGRDVGQFLETFQNLIVNLS